jgi:hypothetical protein
VFELRSPEEELPHEFPALPPLLVFLSHLRRRQQPQLSKNLFVVVLLGTTTLVVVVITIRVLRVPRRRPYIPIIVSRNIIVLLFYLIKR